MSNYTPVVVMAVLGTAIAVRMTFTHRRNMRVYGDAWRAYNAGAFTTKVEPYEKNYEIVTRLADELASGKGQLAVSMAGDGWAIHHINKNGTFAKRGPYYISKYRYNWRPTGRRLLITTVRGRGGHGFRSDHYNQKDGVISEKGWSVLEYDTKKYSPLSLSDFVHYKCRNGPLRHPV